MRKILAFAFILFFISAMLPAFAADPILENATISTGGTVKLEGGGYSLQDIKGQPAAGAESTSADGKYKLGPGGIYQLAVEEEKLLPGKGGVSGQAVNQAGNNLSNVKVIAYTGLAILKTDFTGADGKYKILNLDPGIYYLEASKDGYISSYQSVNLEAGKIAAANFTLTAGKSAPAGTIGLIITRVINSPDLKISWTEGNDPGQVAPGGSLDIYMALGYGSGDYQNAYDDKKWPKAIASGKPTAGYTSIVMDAANHNFIYKNQFGTGFKELYFKGLAAGQVPGASHPNSQGTYFSQAPAVGKMNLSLSLSPKWNLVSIPFELPKNCNIDTAFFNQLREEGAYFYAFDDAAQSTSKLSFDGAKWTLEGPAYSVKSGSAYWVWLPSEKTITVLGGVLTDNFVRPLYPGFSLLGYPFPNNISTFANAGLSPSAGHAAYWFYGATQATLKLEPLNNAWTDASGKGLFGLKPGNGYWYYNAGNTINWTITKP